MSSRKKILIVDDTIDTVELLRKRLRAENYETDEAYDGEECLRKVGECAPDLIVLDIMMPKMDGYEVCRRLKASETTKYIPVLMLTAKSDVENRVKGLDLGAEDYLPKPFDYKELAARIRSLLTAREAQEQLAEEEKSEALDQIVDEVAHEVRNPLASLGGFARRVYNDLPEGSPNRKYMEMILEDVKRIENMVRQLVELQSLTISYREATDINDVILRTIDCFDAELEEKAADLELDLAEGLPQLQADREQLATAIGNLIRNAIESMTAEKRVLSVSSRMEEGQIEISISDTGKGISKEKLKNIFDPLYTSKMFGPGLGLTFALKIVQNHRGTISVESEPGRGTTFTVRLPVKKK